MAPLGMLGKGEVGEIVNLRPGGRSQAGQHGHRHHAHGPENGKRLAEMGMLVGEVVRIEGFAPLGNPVEITVRRYRLSLRNSDLENITVEEVRLWSRLYRKNGRARRLRARHSSKSWPWWATPTVARRRSSTL